MSVDTEDIQDRIRQEAEAQGIPPDIALAVAEQESSFNQDAVGSSGERGVFQIMAGTAGDLGIDPEDLDQNIEGGVRYLKELNEQTDGDWDDTLTSYNGGIGNLQRGTTSAAARKYPELVNARRSKFQDSERPESTEAPAEKTSVAYAKPKPINQDVPPTSKGFADLLLKQTNTPEFDALPFPEQTKVISDLYKSKKWDRESYNLFKEVMTTVWDGADPDQLPNIADMVGAPPISAKDPVKETAAWKTKVIQDLHAQGISPGVFGNRLDGYINQASQDEIDAFAIRNESFLGGSARAIGNDVRQAAKGAISVATNPVAGIARLSGAYETADTIQNIPELLGKPNNSYLFETDETGHLKLDENNQPIERWRGQIAQGVGNVGATIAGGFALRGVGVATSAISKGLFTTNTLSSANNIFKDVYDKTGNVGQSYAASLFALPAAAVQTLGEAAVISKFANPIIQGLSPYNQTKYLGRMYTRLHAAAGNAGIEGTAEGLGNLTEQVGQSTQTGAPVDWNQVRINAVVGGIVGGGVGAITGGRSDTGNEQLPPVIKGPNDEDGGTPPPPPAGEVVVRGTEDEQVGMASKLEAFQKHPAQELVLTQEEASKVHPDLLSTFELDVTPEGSNYILRKKTSYIPVEPNEEITVLDEQITVLNQDILKDGTPDDSFGLTEKLSNLKKQYADLEKSIGPVTTGVVKTRSNLENELKAKRNQLDEQIDPILRQVAYQELQDAKLSLDTFDAANEAVFELPTRLSDIGAEIETVQSKLAKGQQRTYANDISAKQANLEGLLRKRKAVISEIKKKQADAREKALSKPKGSTEGEAKNAPPPEIQSTKEIIEESKPEFDVTEGSIAVGNKHVAFINGKPYVLNKNGDVVGKGHDYYSNAVKEAAGVSTETEAVAQGGKELPPLEPPQTVKLNPSTSETFQGNNGFINYTKGIKPGDALILNNIIYKGFRSQGRGSKMIEDFSVAAKEAGYKRIVLDSVPDEGTPQEKLNKFYIRNGFKPTGENEGREFVKNLDDSVGAKKATGLKREALTTRLATSDTLSPLITRAFGGDKDPGLSYKPQTRSETIAQGQDFIAEHGGIEGATKALLDLPVNYVDPSLNAIGAHLIDVYDAQTKIASARGNIEAAEAAAKLSYRIGEDLAQRLTLGGQFIEAAKIWARFSPETYIKKVEAAIKEHNLPGISDADKARIKELMAKAKETGGTIQQNILNEVGQIENRVTKGVFNAGTSPFFQLWQASVLSDPSTQAVNLIGNISQLVGSASSFLFTGLPRGNFDGLEMLKGFYRGAMDEGFSAAMLELQGIKTYKPQAEKFGTDSRGPAITKDDFVKNAPLWMKKIGLNNLGYVFRALSATDAFFYKTAQEGMGRLAAYKVATEEGLTGTARKNRIGELLYDSTKSWNDAAAQAKREVAAGAEVGIKPSKALENLRTWEILEESRPESIRNESLNFASKNTFNNKPEGVIGRAVESLNKFGNVPIKIGSKEIRPFKYLFPFMNVAGNIANASLDYTPVGAFRAGLDDTLSSLERRNTLGKFMLGSVLAGTLYGIAKEFQDDKDPYIALFGAGPKNYAQNKAWKESGARPYSLKIGENYFRFSESPIGILLGGIAGMLDAERYDKSFERGNYYEMVGASISGSLKSFADNSFLKTLGSVVKAATGEERVDVLNTLLIQPAKGFIPAVGAQRAITKMLDDPIETKNDFYAKLVNGTVFAMAYDGKPALNAFGKPVERSWEDRLSAIGRFYSERVTEAAPRWLAETGYTLPDFGVTVAGSKGLKNRRAEDLGAAFADTLTPDERYQLIEKAGPLIEQRVLQYKDHYGNQEFSQKVQDQLVEDVKQIRSRVKKQIVIGSIESD